MGSILFGLRTEYGFGKDLSELRGTFVFMFSNCDIGQQERYSIRLFPDWSVCGLCYTKLGYVTGSAPPAEVDFHLLIQLQCYISTLFNF